MPRNISAAIPAAPRMPLLNWIELDDGDATSFTRPACDGDDQTLHARIIFDPNVDKGEAFEALQPSSGLRLPPLG
jgi:hypothetical protein